MRVPLWLLAVIVWEIGSVAAQAQTTTTSGMGPTSPLDVPSANNSPSASTSSGLANIPLGSTEINTPGVSPLVIPCPTTNSNAAFDGGGSSLSTNCSLASSNNGGVGAASKSGVGGTNSGPSVAGTSVVGSNIPLGATTLATPGESQTTAVPGVAPCLPQVNATQSSTGSGRSSSTVNGGC
jgi:hypothetical protein